MAKEWQGIMEREILKLDLSETSRFNCAPEQVFAASEGHHLLQRHGVRGVSEHARLGRPAVAASRAGADTRRRVTLCRDDLQRRQ